MKKASVILRAASLAAFVFLLTRPELVSASAGEAIAFCADVIVPSLFVYMVLSELFGGAAAYFSGRAFPYIMILSGALCGSPSGACTIRALRANGSVTERQAECLLPVCSNPSASFIVSFAGAAVIGSLRAGVFILAAKLALSFTMWKAISLTALPPEERRFALARPDGKASLTSAIKCAASSVGTICACVVFFAVLADTVTPFCGGAAFGCLIRGAFEFSGGIGGCAALDPRARYVAVCALIGWQGMCVHLQVSASVGESVRMKTYFAVKTAETFLMTLFGLLTKSAVI